MKRVRVVHIRLDLNGEADIDDDAIPLTVEMQDGGGIGFRPRPWALWVAEVVPIPEATPSADPTSVVAAVSGGVLAPPRSPQPR